MKISETSLHYKFNKHWTTDSESMPSTLCGYFWYTLFNVLRSIMASIVGVFLASFCLSPLFRFFTKDELAHDAGTLALYIYGIVAVILVGGLFFNKSSFGRVLFEYIKTLKTKMCPLIEYEGVQDDSSIRR